MINNSSSNDIYIQISQWLEIYHSTASVKEKEHVKTLIVTNMYPIIKHIARTIARRATDPIEDLVQAGFIGLLKAIDRYDARRNDNFRVYAGYLIIGEMKHFLRDQLNTIRVPRHIQELTIRINNFIQNLTPDEVEKLTNNDVANALKVSPKVIDYVLEVDRRKNTVSLDDVFNASNNTQIKYEDFLADGDFQDISSYEDARIIFEKVIDKLPPDEKVLIDMHYKQNMSQKEIAEALIMKPMAVSRKIKQAYEIIAEMVSKDKEAMDAINNGDFR